MRIHLTMAGGRRRRCEGRIHRVETSTLGRFRQDGDGRRRDHEGVGHDTLHLVAMLDQDGWTSERSARNGRGGHWLLVHCSGHPLYRRVGRTYGHELWRREWLNGWLILGHGGQNVRALCYDHAVNQGLVHW